MYTVAVSVQWMHILTANIFRIVIWMWFYYIEQLLHHFYNALNTSFLHLFLFSVFCRVFCICLCFQHLFVFSVFPTTQRFKPGDHQSHEQSFSGDLNWHFMDIHPIDRYRNNHFFPEKESLMFMSFHLSPTNLQEHLNLALNSLSTQLQLIFIPVKRNHSISLINVHLSG